MARMLLDDWLEALDGTEGDPYAGLLALPAPAAVVAPAPAPVAAPVAVPVAAEPAGQWVRMPSGGEGWEDVFVPAPAPMIPGAQLAENTEVLGSAPFDWAKYGWAGGDPKLMDTREVGEAGVATPYVAGVTQEFADWLKDKGLQVNNYGDDSGAVGVWDLSKDGEVIDRHVDQISSTDQLLNQLAPALITAVAAPGLSQALFGGGLLGSVGAGALLGGFRAAGEGDNILEGALKGGASGGVGNLVSSAFGAGNALAGASPVDAGAILQEGLPELTSLPVTMPASLAADIGIPASLATEIAITPEVIQQLMPQVTPEVAQQIAADLDLASAIPEAPAPENLLSQQVPVSPEEILAEPVQTDVYTPEPLYTPVYTPEPVAATSPIDYGLIADKPAGLKLPQLGSGYDLAPAPVFDNGTGLLGTPEMLSPIAPPVYTYSPPVDYSLAQPTTGLQPSAVPSNIGITAPAAGGGTLTQFGVIPDTATPTLGSGGLLNAGAAQTAASNASTLPTADPYANETAKLMRQQEIAQSGTPGGGLGNMSGSAAVLPSQVVNMSPLEEAMQSLKTFTGPLTEWANENPVLARLIFTGGGALLSTAGGGGGNGGGNGYTYNGPMPTIKRGPFQAPRPRYLTPSPQSTLSLPQAQRNDGLLRFLGG